MRLTDWKEFEHWLLQRWGVIPPETSTDTRPIRVTAVIPTHRQTPIGLAALRAQDCEIEVLVLSNGETEVDGDRVIQMEWLGHGATRQAGVEAANGDYILFTVDDALPCGSSCVRTLVNALEEGGFDAVMGRQLPWPQSDLLTQERLAQWTPGGTTIQTRPTIDHVFALYRRDTLLNDPLPDVPIGEDLHWSLGKKIGYVPIAPVIHAHRRSPRSLFDRTQALHVEHFLVGNAPSIPDFASVIRALPSALKAGIQYGPREVPNQIAEILGQWRGAVQGRRRRHDAKIVRTQPKP